MEQKEFADQYVMINADKFNSNDIPMLKGKLEHLPQDRQTAIQTITLKSPIVALILSLFLGGLAVDRFYLGDIVLGIIKLVTVFFVIGVFWVIIDWFLTYRRAKTINFHKVMMLS